MHDPQLHNVLPEMTLPIYKVLLFSKSEKKRASF